jgi:flagellar protein FliO/FliZ
MTDTPPGPMSRRSLPAAVTLLAAWPAGVLAQAPAAAAPSLLPILTALLAVLALIPVAVWLLKRFGPAPAAPAAMQVVGQVSLGAGQRIVVLQAGSRWLLLGVTAGSITRLGNLPRPPGDTASLDAAAISAPSFGALLAGAVRGNRKGA